MALFYYNINNKKIVYDIYFYDIMTFVYTHHGIFVVIFLYICCSSGRRVNEKHLFFFIYFTQRHLIYFFNDHQVPTKNIYSILQREAPRTLLKKKITKRKIISSRSCVAASLRNLLT